MQPAAFVLSAFGDEIDDDLESQLRSLRELRIGSLEFRSAWGKNVLHLNDSELLAVSRLCQEYSISISCIGSPIGKTAITEPVEIELKNLTRIIEISQKLGCQQIRIFSFFPPPQMSQDQLDYLVDEAAARLGRLAKLAEQHNVLLLLENEKGVVGDTPQRCFALMRRAAGPHLQFLWDPANFVQVMAETPMRNGWPPLAEYVSYIHVKDARLSDGSVCAAGEGDGQLPELLTALIERGYKGVLALEPHLASAGPHGGFSGPEGMRYAVKKLRGLLQSVGGLEQAAGGG